MNATYSRLNAPYSPNNPSQLSNSLRVQQQQNFPSANQPHRLPLETLRQIFMYCMAGNYGDLDPAKPPLLLRRVSHTWQALADSIPSLWSSIAVTPSQFIPANVSVVKEWLGRSSSTSPLNLALHAPPHPDRSLLLAILAEFMPYCRRWKCLGLHIPVEYLPVILKNPAVPLPSLESLGLSIDSQPRFTINSSAIRLRSITLTIRPPLFQPQGNLFDLAWNQITYLNIRTIAETIEAIWGVFLNCPQLLTLIVSATNNPSIPRIPFHPGRLCRSKLRYLTMSVNAPVGVVGYFLDGLYLPDLQELSLHFTALNDNPCIWPGVAIVSLRDRCIPPLVKVTVTGKVVPEAELIHFIRRMKYLEQLTIDYGARGLVTPAAAALLSQTGVTAEQRRAAYQAELEAARFHGRTV